MRQYKNLRVFAAIFFWGMLLSYLWVAPKMYIRMTRGYADFSNFYTAGKIVQMGQRHHLYDLALQEQVQSQFSEPVILHKRALPFMRPAFEALLFLPLSYLSYAHAYAFWVLSNVLLLGVAVAYLRWRIPEPGYDPASSSPASLSSDMAVHLSASISGSPWWLYYPACFSFFAVFYGFVLGQDSVLMVLLFGLVMVHWFEHKDFRAGCFLGLALIKFQLVLPLVLILFLKRQFRALAGFSAVGAVLAALSVWVVGWEGAVAYPVYLWQLSRKGSAAAIYPSVMPSLRGLLEGWTDPLHPLVGLDVVTGLLSLGLLIWAARQWHTDAPRASNVYAAGMSVVFLAALLAGYHEFSYDLSVLFPVIFLAACTGLHAWDLDSATRWMLVLGAFTLLYCPLGLFLVQNARLNLMALVLLLLAWGFARAIRVWRAAATVPQPIHPIDA